VAAVAVLTLATAPEDHGGIAWYNRLTISAALTAGLIAVVACTMPRRDWQLPPLCGRAAIIGACLLILLNKLYRVLDPDDFSAEQGKALAALTAFGVAVWTCVARRGPASQPTAVVAALALLVTGEGVFCSTLVGRAHEGLYEAVRVAAVAGFLLTASLVVHLPETMVRWRRLFAGQVAALFVAGGVLRVAGALAVAEPPSDVYYAQHIGAEYLVRGENPYAGEYANPQSPGDHFDSGAPFYPPLPLLLGAGFRAAGLDVRLGNAVCDLVAALVLLVAGGMRGERLLGAFLAAAYLHYPRVPAVMELAWYEPMLAAAFGVGLLLVARGWKVGYAALGLGFSGKQYAVVMFPALLKAYRGRRLLLVIATAAVSVGVVLPLLLLAPQAFFYRVVSYHLNLPLRMDGVTIRALLKHEFGVDAPGWLMASAAIAVIGLVTWRAPVKGPSPAPWMAASLLTFCLFHSQAFVNYYYLCQYLMLLGLGDWFVSEGSGTRLAGGTGPGGEPDPAGHMGHMGPKGPVTTT
jgi:hypothetical protein